MAFCFWGMAGTPRSQKRDWATHSMLVRPSFVLGKGIVGTKVVVGPGAG
jgi:hypothetical protein